MTKNPYTPMRQIVDGLWCVEGWWKRSPMGRRMTVLHVGGDRLAVHSAIKMDVADMERLDAMGRVAYIIAPNPFHASESPWYAERYPEAKTLVPAAMRRKQERRMRIDGTLEDAWPEELTGELEALLVEGLRLPETAYFHVRSRTLVVTDLVANYGNDHFKGIFKVIMKWNNMIDRFGPSHGVRYLAMKNKAELRASLARIAEWDFDRVVMNHGRVLETGGKAKMAEEFAFLGR